MSEVTVSFRATSNPPGLRVRDPIQGRQLHFQTPRDVTPEPTDAERFLFPTDATCAIETKELAIDRMYETYVRDVYGTLLEQVRAHQNLDIPEDTYIIEISAPIKLYLRVNSPVSIKTDANFMRLSFGNVTPVEIGGRSYHEKPASTITTTEEPRDVMQAISMFSSAIKTTKPEVSYPTLRGHPPLIDLGEELDIPGGLKRPDTGIRIEVPPERRMIYPISSLAFYLGAEVVPGETPRLLTEDGFEYQLLTEQWYEDEVASVLRQLLTLDAIVRTDGYYGGALYERERIESHLPIDIRELYSRSMKERITEYLKIEYRLIKNVEPRWGLTAYVPSTPEGVETLPFVVNELGIIRTPRGRRVNIEEIETETGMRPGHGPQQFHNNDSRVFVEPERFDDSVEHLWFGEHIPIGATKGNVESFRNELMRTSPIETIDIAVICNDDMLIREPDILDEVYQNREMMDYAITTNVGLSIKELISEIDTGYDFVHFIGNTRDGGFVCPDGVLQVRDLETISSNAFLLDADDSYNLAHELTKRGAYAAIGTVGRIRAEKSVEIGRAIAQLLNIGFPIRAALDIVREQTDVGRRYIIAGDGSLDIAQPTSSVPFVSDIEQIAPDEFLLEIETYPSGPFRLGSTVSPALSNVNTDFLCPGKMLRRFPVSEFELREFLTWHFCPIRIDGELYWNNTLDTSAFQLNE